MKLLSKLAISTILTSGLLINTATAEQLPSPLPSDDRIKEFVYDPQEVYKLDLYLKSITALEFEPGEMVASILVGDSASWEIVKLNSGNVVSVKPIIEDAHTNMTIYTDRRVYSFEMQTVGTISQGEKAAESQAFRTIFTYPEAKLPKIDADGNAQTGGDLTVVIDEKAVQHGPENLNYMVGGDGEFKPVKVFDTGQQTHFVLPAQSQRPAIFRLAPDGSEMLVNSRTNGDTITVDGTADTWILRIGDETVHVRRTAREAVAVPTERPDPSAATQEQSSSVNGIVSAIAKKVSEVAKKPKKKVKKAAVKKQVKKKKPVKKKTRRKASKAKKKKDGKKSSFFSNHKTKKKRKS